MEKISFSLLEKLPPDSFYVIHNGKLLENWRNLKSDDFLNVHVVPRVLGGKGGFGSLLRSFGSQFYKSTNQDMCRDLTGRRLKDVKEEEKLKKYIKKAQERDEQRKKKTDEKLEKLKRFVPQKNGGVDHHEFVDQDYSKTKEIIAEKTEDAVRQGLKAAVELNPDDQPGTSGVSATRKRPASPAKNDSVKSKKVKKSNDLWLGMGDLEDDSSSGEEEIVTKKKCSDKKSIIADNVVKDSKNVEGTCFKLT